MNLEKVEKIVKLAQLLSENPDISAEELDKRLKLGLRNVYNYLNEFQKRGIPTSLRRKGQRAISILYDPVEHLTLALSQPELSLLHKSVEAMLQKKTYRIDGIRNSNFDACRRPDFKSTLGQTADSSRGISSLNKNSIWADKGEIRG